MRPLLSLLRSALLAACLMAPASPVLAQSPAAEPAAEETAQVVDDEPPPDLSALTLLEIRREDMQAERSGLAREEQDLVARKKDLPSRLDRAAQGRIALAQIDEARLSEEIARLRLQESEVEWDRARSSVLERKLAVSKLEQEWSRLGRDSQSEQGRAIRAAVENGREAQALESANEENLNSWQGIHRRRWELAHSWRLGLERIYRKQEERRLQANLETLVRRVGQERRYFQKEAEKLRGQVSLQTDRSGGAHQPQLRLLETRLLNAEERLFLLQMELKQAQASSESLAVDSLLALGAPGPEAVERALRLNLTLQQSLGLSLTLLEEKRSLFHYRRVSRGGSEPAEGKTLLDKLEKDYAGLSEAVEVLLDGLQTQRARLETVHQKEVREGLLTRSQLPVDWDSWTNLAQELAQAPLVLLRRSWEIGEDLLLALRRSSLKEWAMLLLAQMAWIGALLGVRFLARTVSERSQGEGEAAFTRRAARMALELVRMEILPVMLAGMPLLAAWQLGLSSITLHLLATALLPLLAAKGAIDLAWLALVSPFVAPERRQPRLYRQIFRVAALGGGLTAVVLLGRLAFFSPPVLAVADRLFMLFVLLLLIPMRPIRRLTLERVKPRLGPYWFKMAQWLSLLAPLSILSAVLLGLAGYLGLAAAVGGGLGWFLLVLTGWLAANGIVQDLFSFLYRWTTRLGQGGLWSQGVLTPLHRISRLGVFFGAWAVLFHLYGWGEESPVMRFLKSLLFTPIFGLGKSDISLGSILMVVVIIAVLVWLGHWTRQIFYRWLLSAVVDLGVRNSLAVLAQYVVVILGFLFTLRTAGMDLTSLAVFAGAAGVGIGLGLQDIAKNFFGGLLLLIERPLRSGDYVTIRDKEGTVTRIGVRSLTIRSRDNLEIIVPIADVISSPLVNWTHSDPYVRTIFLVGVSYDTDLRLAKQVMEQALTEVESVVKNPGFKVLLWEYAASSINFRVQFFSDMRKVPENDVKSEALFAIWNKLQEAGIVIPFPQLEVKVLEKPDKAEA
ncbi:MAG: mechanosensitive ion channel [Magnetococcales bacterium]|nr:mechanosensitive ion channel [Magnetococcales bacterium]